MREGQLLRSGDRIQHPTYGIGRVLKVWRSGKELVAKVKWTENYNAAFSVVITEATTILKAE